MPLDGPRPGCGTGWSWSLYLIHTHTDLVTEKGKAAWFLALLSPIMAEMLSGSSPPLEFIFGFGFLFLIPMYGGGALLVRELTVRWDKGWATVIILGAAYGIIEEGIAVKSFFDPAWVDLGALGEYGRLFEVNWVWSVWLTIFHSMISISLPILMLGLWYPRLRNESILTKGQFKLVGYLFVIDIAFCAFLFVSIQDYVPPLIQYSLCFVIVYLLIQLARRVPKDIVSARHHMPSWGPMKFLALGFLTLTGSFIFASSAPEPLPFPLAILVLMVMSAGSLLLLQHKLGATGNSVHKAYFAVGVILLFILLGPIHEVFNGMLGMSVVSIGFAVFSLMLIGRARSYESAAKGQVLSQA